MMTRWHENPFVKEAIAAAAADDEPTPLRTAEELLRILNEVEDRFPGVPFGELIADRATQSGGDLRRIRNTLRRNGACQADIELVCPNTRGSWIGARKESLESDPYDERSVRL